MHCLKLMELPLHNKPHRLGRYNQSICKLLYFRDLHIKRQKSDDVHSKEAKKGDDLTFLTFLNHNMRFEFAFLSIISETTSIFFIKVSYILQWHVFCYISYWCIRLHEPTSPIQG